MTDKEIRPKAFSYLRFSTPEQERGDSFRRQTAAAAAYAEANGLILDDSSFQDLGVSAYRGANAETGMLGEFLEGVRNGAIPAQSYLLVESLDRLSRNKPRRAVRLLEDICDEGIKLVTLADGKKYDAQTLDDDPMSFMWAFMVAIRANEESAMKSRRLKAAWNQKRATASTNPLTGRTPGWLLLRPDTKQFEVIEDRASIVRQMFDLTLAGVGQHAIAQSLNRKGTPTFGRGAQWHRSYIAKTLKNAAVVGTLIPHTVEYVKGKKTRIAQPEIKNYFPAIVAQETFDRVQSLLAVKQPQRGRHSRGAVRNLIGGLATCPLCSSTMTLVNKGNRSKPFLVCTKAKAGAGCRYRSVPYAQVEDRLIEVAPTLFKLINIPEAAGSALDAAIDEAEGELEVTEEAIENLMLQASHGTSARLAERLREEESRFDELLQKVQILRERKVQQSDRLTQAKVRDLSAAMRTDPMDRRLVNTCLRQLFQRVVVDYETGSLFLHWAHGQETDIAYAMPED